MTTSAPVDPHAATATLRDRFAGCSPQAYLDTASYGLPPDETVAAVAHALEQWRAGSADWVTDWDPEGEACRMAFARLCGVRALDVALLPAVSVAAGLAMASLPAGGTVLLAEGDFTSVLFPALVAEQRGCRVRWAPPERFVDAIDDGVDLVAVSHVHAGSGVLIDVPALVAAAQAAGARTFLDATHALGALAFDVGASGIDYLACAAYKFLLCPRGVAFLYVREGAEPLPPLLAGWRAADAPYARYFGGPLTLAAGAAALDVSLAWHAWIGARPSLELLAALDPDVRQARATAAVRHVAERLGLAPPGAAVLSVAVADGDGARAALAAAGVRASVRNGRVRLSSHVYTSEEDAERTVAALRPHLSGAAA